jgi:Na+/melibiose symporter-like transporter
MTEEIQKFTKLTFIIHFVIAIIFTILFFIPDISGPFALKNPSGETHALTLTIASLFAALTVSSLFGFLAKEWKEVKIVVILEIVWLVAGLITTIINYPVYTVAMFVLSLLMCIILLALFLLAFLQQEDKMKALL